MSKNKTTANNGDVISFLNDLKDEKRKEDSLVLLEMMKGLFKDAPKMWGSSIIGFGEYHYRYESGREGDFFKAGFSPRKNALSIYIMSGLDRHQEKLSQLGKYKKGKSCLYVKRLEDVDINVLSSLIEQSYEQMTKKYG